MADDDLRVKIALALELIDDPASDPGALIDALAALSSQRPVSVIDLTDPPTPPRFVLGDIEVSAADIDAAARALGAALRPRLAELARATGDLPAVDLAAPAAEG